MTTDAQGPVAAVYRQTFLPRSETFVRDHLVRMPRYRTIAVTSRLSEDPLPVPGHDPVVARAASPLPRVRAAVWRRTGHGPRAHAEALADTFRRSRADLVHAHFGPDGALALEPARRARKPLVVTFHGYDVTTEPEHLRSSEDGALLLRRWDQLVRTAGIITVSRFLKDILVARGADPARVHVIGCGVDVDAFEVSPFPERPELVFVGRLVEKKGVGDALEALAGLEDPPHLTVLGDGPLRGELEARAAALRLPVTFRGVATTEEIRSALARATAVVMPSRRAPNGDSEGLGVTALEAGASGRPLVGYAHGGLSEAVVDGVTGRLAPEGDVDGLRAVLRTVLDDLDGAADMGRRAREHVVSSFDQDAQLRRVADVYDEVLSRRR
ncbi:glycosyltransferase [Kineococcus sp. DHX-1]|uniref:glycosyltransferase n=1 Tax=Kineococcus sp. DHX-1 TaxID=3349638 RepID=UPI0036D2781A